MEKLKSIFWVLVGIIILLSLPIGIYYLGKAFLAYLNALNATVAASIIAASGTAFAAVFTVVIGQHINKKREIEDAHRERKSNLYSKFIEFTINWVFKHSDVKNTKEEQRLQKELEKFFIEFSKDLMLWASPGVIKAWSAFRDRSVKSEGNNILLDVDAIYKAMRKDLGNSNFGLESGALVKLFLNEDRHNLTPNTSLNQDAPKSGAPIS